MMKPYELKTFALGELDGLSAKQIEEHLKLYAGYVKNTNLLMEKVKTHMQNSEAMAVELSELTRRMGFEWNGMRLHEVYFSQFEKGGEESTKLSDALTAQYGSFEAWKNQVSAMGVMRGIGWVLLINDKETGNLHTIWVSDHEYGHLAGTDVVFAMDVWEHAYTVDFAPTQRAAYIQAFWKNVNWNKVEARYA
ncbi:MAG: Fe-Mn family superoxide dismutase [Patescibacteria group bacterium]